jgi:hypothetical protein
VKLFFSKEEGAAGVGDHGYFDEKVTVKGEEKAAWDRGHKRER